MASTVGRVCTGFSKPYVATYSYASSAVTYSGCTVLARGVNVKIEPEEAGDDNSFYADNAIAETISGAFGGGTLTLTVDGLIDATRKLILGLPTADSDGFTHYGDGMSVPYCGVGFVARYQSQGTSYYVPIVLTKVKFNVPADNAATAEEDIEWQTEELTATILRDDTSTHDWKLVGGEETTEAAAVTKLTTFFGGSST